MNSLSQTPFVAAFSLKRLPTLHSTRDEFFTRMMKSGGSSNEMIKTLVPNSNTVSELEIKKSKFIGYAAPIESWEAAVDYIAQVKREHPKARHVCHGFKCGLNERCSDDGEPTGTAGQPILNAIRGEELSDVICIVVRYFGGIKLGAGGLIRAYGAAARQALREAPVFITAPKASLLVSLDSSFTGVVYDAAAKVHAIPSGESYDSDGRLTLTLTCEKKDIDDLRLRLMDATKGEAVIINADQYS